MDVVKTNIIDSNIIDGSETSKLLLMNNLIDNFSPLFYEDLRKKQGQVKSNKADIKKLVSIVKADKKKLAQLKLDVRKERLKKQILYEIRRLNSIDVLYGKNKTTVLSILKSLDEYSFETMENRLSLLQKLVKQRKDD